jgi:hypothetical protein
MEMKVEIIELKDSALLGIIKTSFPCYIRNKFGRGCKVIFQQVVDGRMEGTVDGGVVGYFDVIWDSTINEYKAIPAE